MTTESLLVGRIVKAHGIKGEVSIEVLSDIPGRFAPGARYTIDDRDLVIASSRLHQGRMLVRFEDVFDRNEAEELRGAELTISASAAPELTDGSFYTFQLIGCDVFDESGARLGTLKRVDENKANDLWVVSTREGEVLVPAVRDIVASVDVDARRIVLNPPEGLFPE